MGAVPDQLSEFGARLVAALLPAVGESLTGVYLHGSAVLGDWDPRGSDVDVLVVAQADEADEYAGVLEEARAYCPGTGLESSVVLAGAARAPIRPWPFLVHVTGDRIVLGRDHGGDDDLILHYAVARAHGWAAFGPPSHEVFGALARGVVLGQLARELRWAVGHAGESYAVLNACRALRFRNENVLCSKTAGGQWALHEGIAEVLVQRALSARDEPSSERECTGAATEWVRAVAGRLVA